MIEYDRLILKWELDVLPYTFKQNIRKTDKFLLCKNNNFIKLKIGQHIQREKYWFSRKLEFL